MLVEEEVEEKVGSKQARFLIAINPSIATFSKRFDVMKCFFNYLNSNNQLLHFSKVLFSKVFKSRRKCSMLTQNYILRVEIVWRDTGDGVQWL